MIKLGLIKFENTMNQFHLDVIHFEKKIDLEKYNDFGTVLKNKSKDRLNKEFICNSFINNEKESSYDNLLLKNKNLEGKKKKPIINVRDEKLTNNNSINKEEKIQFQGGSQSQNPKKFKNKKDIESGEIMKINSNSCIEKEADNNKNNILLSKNDNLGGNFSIINAGEEKLIENDNFIKKNEKNLQNFNTNKDIENNETMKAVTFVKNVDNNKNINILSKNDNTGGNFSIINVRVENLQENNDTKEDIKFKSNLVNNNMKQDNKIDEKMKNFTNSFVSEEKKNNNNIDLVSQNQNFEGNFSIINDESEKIMKNENLFENEEEFIKGKSHNLENNKIKIDNLSVEENKSDKKLNQILKNEKYSNMKENYDLIFKENKIIENEDLIYENQKNQLNVNLVKNNEKITEKSSLTQKNDNIFNLANYEQEILDNNRIEDIKKENDKYLINNKKDESFLTQENKEIILKSSCELSKKNNLENFGNINFIQNKQINEELIKEEKIAIQKNDNLKIDEHLEQNLNEKSKIFPELINKGEFKKSENSNKKSKHKNTDSIELSIEEKDHFEFMQDEYEYCNIEKTKNLSNTKLLPVLKSCSSYDENNTRPNSKKKGVKFFDECNKQNKNKGKKYGQYCYWGIILAASIGGYYLYSKNKKN